MPEHLHFRANYSTVLPQPGVPFRSLLLLNTGPAPCRTTTSYHHLLLPPPPAAPGALCRRHTTGTGTAGQQRCRSNAEGTVPAGTPSRRHCRQQPRVQGSELVGHPRRAEIPPKASCSLRLPFGRAGLSPRCFEQEEQGKDTSTGRLLPPSSRPLGDQSAKGIGDEWEAAAVAHAGR